MSKITKDNIRISRFRGAILGTAIGDALGAPTESMSKAEIIAANVQITNDFIDHFKARGDVIQKRGSWTDDTQLMIPLIESISLKSSLDPLDIANRIADLYKSGEVLRGWSKSTKAVAERLANGVPWFRAADQSLGMGNGFAMKAAPIGLYLAQIMEKNDANTGPDPTAIKHCINSVISVGKITHHELGITAGALQALLIANLVNDVRGKNQLLAVIKQAENDYFGTHRFYDKIRSAVRNRTVEAIAQEAGTDSKADRSWVAAVACFLNTRRRQDAIKTMSELIMAGGDTDTTAAIYGALAGAKWGVSVFPQHLRKNVESSKTILELADKLFHNT